MPHTTLRLHHKLRGRIWRGLEEVDEYAATHDTDYGVGFAFSNVFPWGDIDKGDRRYLRNRITAA